MKVVIFATGATVENFFHNFFFITKKTCFAVQFFHYFVSQFFLDEEEKKLGKKRKNHCEKTQNMTKPKESNFDTTQKLKISQNSKTQIGR